MTDMKDPQVVLTGNPVDGFELFGPTPLDDEDGRREARTRRLEELGDDWWLAPLRPLDDLETVDGVDDTDSDADVPGIGTVHAADTYLTLVANGRRIAAYALAGIELLEAVDWLPSGRPDWANASICDAAHGDGTFIQAVVTVLRNQNTPPGRQHSWPEYLHDQVQRALRVCARRGLIADWERDSGDHGYTIALPDARLLALRTPQQAHAFLGVLTMMFTSTTLLRAGLPGPATIRQIAADIVDLIRVDIRGGVVPLSVKSTADLVRHRDLPGYCAALDPPYDINAEAFSTVSALCDQIDASIAQGRLLTDDGSPMPARP